MQTYFFDVEIEELDREDETWIDFFATRKFEAFFSWRDFQTYLNCYVEAETPGEVLDMVFTEIAKTELSVLRIVVDLIGVQDIAIDYSVSRETARLWANGHRRNGFPKRFTQVGNKSAWARSDVHAWAVKNNLAREATEQPLPIDVVEMFNGDLARSRIGNELRPLTVSLSE
ncbi:hypothetical protein [Aurantimicrobium photophilum]|uniref:DNA-binding protein n=1 Tax=Aurantimicrobium photophilum TaxID=1987356 RepID=A0A2Z3S0V0_9MICO|nr:hypothetical protein [Aurantimicrobium photophilum]AWR22330.1 hypothetical protein AURMO_01748 [Aurantimicrobium photophilum]